MGCQAIHSTINENHYFNQIFNGKSLKDIMDIAINFE